MLTNTIQIGITPTSLIKNHETLTTVRSQWYLQSLLSRIPQDIKKQMDTGLLFSSPSSENDAEAVSSHVTHSGNRMQPQVDELESRGPIRWLVSGLISSASADLL